MSPSERDMYPPMKRNLRTRFPKKKGWEIFSPDRWDGYEPDAVLDRRTRSGFIERVVAEAKFTDRVSEADVRQLNEYVRNLAGGNARIAKKILVVPAGADTSIVPDDITVMYLRSVKKK